MPTLTVYLPDALYWEVKQSSLPCSAICQTALREALAGEGEGNLGNERARERSLVPRRTPSSTPDPTARAEQEPVVDDEHPPRRNPPPAKKPLSSRESRGEPTVVAGSGRWSGPRDGNPAATEKDWDEVSRGRSTASGLKPEEAHAIKSLRTGKKGV